jgi:hypothetical protein
MDHMLIEEDDSPLRHNFRLPGQRGGLIVTALSIASEASVGEMLARYASEIWSFVAGLVGGGIGGSLLTLRISRQNRASGGGSIVDQSKATAKGDIVGGDKRVGTERRS